MTQVPQTTEVSLLQSGAVTKPAFTLPEVARNGNLLLMYGDLFYNSIRIEPTLIDVGNLTTPQTRDITIFNAYLESKTLESIDLSNGEGISITGPSTPYIVKPLESVVYQVTIDIQGPPLIDAVLTFNFPGSEDDTDVSVIGSRIVAFPFYFNDQTVEEYEWNTSVLTSNDGSEQRAKLLEVPRQSLRSTSTMERMGRNTADNLLFGWRAKVWALPQWQETRLFTGTIPTSTAVINVDTTFTSLVVGGLIILWQNTMKFDVFVVAALTDTTVTLDRPTEEDYVNPVIASTLLARLTDSPSRFTTGDNGFIRTDFEMTNNVEIGQGLSPTQYLTYDVAEFEALKVGEYVEDKYQGRVDVLDFKTGQLSLYTPWTNNKTSRGFRIVLEGQQEVFEFKEWLHRRAGKWRPFWLQSYEMDYTIIDKGTLIGNTFFAVDEAQAAQGAAKSNVAINLKDGTIIYAGIVSKEVTIEGELFVTLDTSINKNANEIDFISNLGFKRLSSDRVSITHFANNVAECIVPIIEIKP